MEYGFAIVMPHEYSNSIKSNFLEDLLVYIDKTKLATLVSICDFNEKLSNILSDFISDDKVYEKYKKIEGKSCLGIFFIRGNNASRILNEISKGYNKYYNIDRTSRFLNNVYVSENSQEAIDDLCLFLGIEDFKEIESILFNSDDELVTFNFMSLYKGKTRN